MDQLSGTSGLIVGDLLLHGVEIVFHPAFDPRGRVWIPFETGTNLVYGRNGVGKSTLIQAIGSVLGSSPAPADCRVDLYFEFISSPGTEHDGGDDAPERSLNTDLYFGQSESERTFTREISSSYWWQEGVALNDLRDWDNYAEAVMEFVDDPNLVMTIDQWVSTTWGDDESVTLAQARAAYLTYRMAEDRIHWDGDDERPQWDLVSAASAELVEQRIYCLTKSGPHSFVSIAGRISSDTPALAELTSAVQTAVNESKTEILKDCPLYADGDSGVLHPDFLETIYESEFLNNLGPTMALIDWDMPPSQFTDLHPHHPFVRIRSWNEFCRISLAGILGRRSSVGLLDLNPVFDPAAWVRDQLSSIFGHSWNDSWEAIFSSGSGGKPSAEFESSHFESSLRTHQSASEELNRVDIGIGGVRLSISRNLRQWMSGSPAVLECLDSSTQTWVPFERLSPAQQRVVGITLRIQKLRDETELPIVIGDEIDGGLHQLAVKDLYRLISSHARIAYLATHSSTALSMPNLQKIHAFRDGDGHLVARNWTPDLSSTEMAGRALGVDKLQLLACINVAVLVEGAHDEAVLDEVLGAAFFGPASSHGVIVIPMQGHKGVATIADSHLWMGFTDATVVLVVDNSRQEILEPILKKAQELQARGVRPNRIVNDSGLTRTAADLSHEERSLLSVIEQAIRNGDVDRVELSVLSKMDIIEYLPPESFDLEEDWDSLRQQFRGSRVRTDFKSWLRSEKDAHISTGRVRAAAATLDEFHGDFGRLVTSLKNLLARLT